MLPKLLILSLVFILFGCNDSDNSGLVTQMRILDVFEQPSQTFTQGETIIMELTLTNMASIDKTVAVSNGQMVIHILKDANGETVWTWWDGANYFAYVLEDVVLAPNETLQHRVEWDQVVDNQGNLLPVGAYTLEASFDAPYIVTETISSISIL